MTNEKMNETTENTETKTKKKENPTRSYRANPEKHKEISEFLSAQGMTQSDFLSVSLDLVRKEVMKEATGDFEKDLEKIDELTKQMYQSISNLVLSFKVNSQAQKNVYENEKKELNHIIEEKEETLKLTERASLERWDSISRLQIEKGNLYKEFQDYKKENGNAIEKVEGLQQQLLEAKETISSLEKENKTIDRLTREKEKLQSQLEKEKAKFEKQLEVEKTRITSEVWKENFEKITQEKEASLREKLELEYQIKLLQEENQKLKDEKKKK